MRRLLVLAFLLLSFQPAPAASGIDGLWLTQDHDGVIRISNCDGGLCAEIAGFFLDHEDDPTPVNYRGVSQCALPLITDAREIQSNLWKGHITDPRNGSIYGVELHLDSDDNLALRGFLGVPLLGRTQTWTRYQGDVPPDCRIGPANSAAEQGDALANRSAPNRSARAQ